MTRELTLLLPAIADSERAESSNEGRPRPRSFDLLHKRADRLSAPCGLDAMLRQLFELDSAIDKAQALPVAALTLLSDSGERQAGYWLRADPVRIEATQDRLIVVGSDVLNISREEASVLCEEISEQMSPEGLRLLAPTATRWYFSPPETPAVRFSPLPEVVGKDLYEHMPGGEEGRPWRKLLNQVQMVLHLSRVNEERRMKGRPEINGLWFWGGGVLPPVHPCRYQAIWSDDALIRGLAMNAGLQPADLPDSARDWLDHAKPGFHLVSLLEAQESLRAGEIETWHALIDHIEEHWLVLLYEALKDGSLEKLILCPADGSEYHVTRRGLRRWWRWW